MGVFHFDVARTHDLHITSQMRNPLSDIVIESETVTNCVYMSQTLQQSCQPLCSCIYEHLLVHCCLFLINLNLHSCGVRKLLWVEKTCNTNNFWLKRWNFNKSNVLMASLMQQRNLTFILSQQTHTLSVDCDTLKYKEYQHRMKIQSKLKTYYTWH